ncbi:MAG: hypothetical protein HQL14_03505 [Candidatus Omnitrophica bacterium]|nr:hypothetical protein [Candidatus Omnitrophota bacterium]
MKRVIIFFKFIVLMAAMSLCTHSWAATQSPCKKEDTGKQSKADDTDMEVIKRLDLLRNWDIVGPEGPDLNKGAIHAK